MTLPLAPSRKGRGNLYFFTPIKGRGTYIFSLPHFGGGRRVGGLIFFPSRKGRWNSPSAPTERARPIATNTLKAK